MMETHILQWIVPRGGEEGGGGWLCSLLQELGALGWAACIPQDLFTNSRKLAQGSRAPAGPGGL